MCWPGGGAAPGSRCSGIAGLRSGVKPNCTRNFRPRGDDVADGGRGPGRQDPDGALDSGAWARVVSPGGLPLSARGSPQRLRDPLRSRPRLFGAAPATSSFPFFLFAVYTLCRSIFLLFPLCPTPPASASKLATVGGIQAAPPPPGSHPAALGAWPEVLWALGSPAPSTTSLPVADGLRGQMLRGALMRRPGARTSPRLENGGIRCFCPMLVVSRLPVTAEPALAPGR